MENQNTNGNTAPDFGPVIYSYTRSQAIADGFQVEVSKVAQEAGPHFAKRLELVGHLTCDGLGKPITYPVFLTRAVYDNYVAVPPGVTAQDDHDPRSGFKTWGNHLVADLGSQPGRLWDILWMLRFAIRKATGETRLPVALYVRNDNQRARLIKLIATCGPLDLDDPQPAITLMLPDED